MGKFIYIYFLVFFISLSSCHTEPLTRLEAEEVKETVPFTLTPFTIKDVVLEGDTLIAKVQYTGGCGNHTFEIAKNGVLMKSLPPKQPIQITHRSDTDPCRALIQQELKFYIGDFKGTPSGTTVLLLENWPQHIIYSY